MSRIGGRRGELISREKEGKENHQKFEGEYLLATRRRTMVESEDVGTTAMVEEG